MTQRFAAGVEITPDLQHAKAMFDADALFGVDEFRGLSRTTNRPPTGN